MIKFWFALYVVLTIAQFAILVYAVDMKDLRNDEPVVYWFLVGSALIMATIAVERLPRLYKKTRDYLR